MTQGTHESRTVTREIVSLTRGARVGIVLSGLLAVLALFLLLVPLEKGSSTGQPFRCGTAADPATGDFPEAVCGELADRFRLGAAAMAVSAALVGVGAVWVFGTQRRVETRTVHDDD